MNENKKSKNTLLFVLVIATLCLVVISSIVLYQIGTYRPHSQSPRYAFPAQQYP
ncbi:MAG: hypothetical protein PHI40_06055 [Caldisericia bacterium]|nr:hypothetical protein [Caldisericia bacterium]MDD4614950.1 hypothetical protein [Caldisericia bacterium]